MVNKTTCILWVPLARLYPLSFATQSTTHTTLLSGGIHIEHLPVITSSEFVVNVSVARRSVSRSSTVASAEPIIATGIKTMQSSLPTSSSKFDHPLWKTSNCTSREMYNLSAGGLIIALTMSVIWIALLS